MLRSILPVCTKLKLDTPYCDGSPITPATEPEILKFEKMLEYPLPADYRDFLLLVNGGVPCCEPPPVFCKPDGLRFRLGVFFNFGIKNKYALLPMSWKGLRPSIPRYLLPFATIGADESIASPCQLPQKHPDYFGFFLGLSEPVREGVFCVCNKNFGANATSNEDEFVKASGVLKVADSFTDFMNQLKV